MSNEKVSTIEFIPSLIELIINTFAKLAYAEKTDKEHLLEEIKDQLVIIKNSFISLDPNNLNRPYINENKITTVYSWKDYYFDPVKNYFKSVFGGGINLELGVFQTYPENAKPYAVLRLEIYYDQANIRRIYDIHVDLNESKTLANLFTKYLLFRGFPTNVSISDCFCIDSDEKKQFNTNISDALRQELIDCIKAYINSVSLTIKECE